MLVWGLAAFASMFLLVADGNSTPLRPDIRKLVAQPSETVQFAPARAGWDGSETGRNSLSATDPAAAEFSLAATQRATRAALLAAAVPDPRAVVAIVAAILMLRLLRHTHQRQASRSDVIVLPSPPEEKAA